MQQMDILFCHYWPLRKPLKVVRSFRIFSYLLVVNHGSSSLHSQQLIQEFQKAVQDRQPIDVDSVKVMILLSIIDLPRSNI